ncbi:MAG TPA: gephyrin-like molybdotransferase Glp [Negativicutes bacterium]|jgi:molybdopterin molybdotransferase
MKKGVTADEAINIMLAQPVNKKTEIVSVSDAFGRVLTEDIYAQEMVPPFDRSPFDGYAFRGEDTAGATQEHPVILSMTEEIPAGNVPTLEVTAGKAAKILTGAPIPRGANATIKYESTEFSDNEVKIFSPIAPNKDIVPAGEDIAMGDLIASAGTVISPPVMGMLASVGVAAVCVYLRPVITVISTGTELIEADAPAIPAKIRNSSFYTLSGYLYENGSTVRNGGIVVDNPDLIAEKIRAELNHSDLVITTGGVSVGDYDWVVTAVEKLGAEVLFWKVGKKPGGSMMVAVLDGKLILGLSGNAVSAVMGLMQVAMPYIRKLCGRTDLLPPMIEVMLKESFNQECHAMRLLRGRLEFEAGGAYLSQCKSQGHGVISALMGCNLLGEIPAESSPLPAYTKIKAFRM